MTVRTRFAPSPTGYLHIGGVRSALFNWLYARRHGGKFILRIDDTDEQRNIEAALQPILDGFRWLGLDWDEGPQVDGPHAPYYQSQRGDRYRAAVERLLEQGLAYRDFARPEELQAEREAAQQAKVDFQYSRRWMAEDDAQATAFENEGRTAVVRLKMPRSGECRFTDRVVGETAVRWDKEQDHVIQRADGSCLYHLANVVDDYDFEISHVIRGIEHLSNTPRQIFILQGLGYPQPEYAHIPSVAEPSSKTKLSKRKIAHYLKQEDFRKLYEQGERIAQRMGLEIQPETFNPVVVDFYRDIGFLPAALMNYLLLLGWSLDDRTEDFTTAEMIANFSLERIVKAPASFDPAKLVAFQQRRMNDLPVDEKVALVIPFTIAAKWIGAEPSDAERETLRQIVEAAGDRLVIAGDILDYEDFFVADEELEFDAKAWEKRLVKPADAADLLTKFRQEIAGSESFAAADLNDWMHQFVERHQIKMGQIIHAVRVSTTGKAVGFGMFETLEILGRQRVLDRIDRALARLQAG